MESLADVLKKKREELRLTLREVEAKTSLSNAYLSQLENAKIGQPSPSVLRKLSDIYGLSYPRLMELAGHPVMPDQERKSVLFKRMGGTQEITEEEERELAEYLMFLRSRRPKR